MAITNPLNDDYGKAISGGTSITVGEPGGGASQNDIIRVAFYAYRSGGYAVLGTPSGWTREHYIQWSSGSDYNEVGVYWIRRGASAPALSFTVTNSAGFLEWQSQAARGCVTSGNPFTATAVSARTTAANPDPPSVATAAGQRVWTAGYAGNGRGATEWTAPSGYTIDSGNSETNYQFTLGAGKDITSGSSEDPGAFGGAASSGDVIAWSWSMTDSAAASPASRPPRSMAQNPMMLINF